MRSVHYSLTILSVCLFSSGCHTSARKPAIGSQWRADQALSAQDQARMDENCGPLGQPRVRPQSRALIGPTRFVVYEGFALEHSSLDKIPLWVAEHVTTAEVAGDVPRRDAFKEEPSLPAGERAELSDYRGSGYDRGHMAPAGNQTVSADRKRETFTLANMVPQFPQQNQQIWAALEETVRKWAESGEVYTITGPLFWDPQEDSPETADGIIEYFVIGGNDVGVPTHTYKVVARRNANGAWQTIAFVIANDNSFSRPWNFADFVQSVDFVEQRAGIDFFPSGGSEVETSEADRSAMWQ